VRALFTATTLLGSALLFLVQPMVARALLPRTGGVPALWNTCVVFFQFALLAGYAFSHVLPSRLGPRAHAAVHLAALVAAGATLPYAFRSLPQPPDGDPTAWVLRALLVVVAPTFVALATSAPLLQRWWARLGGDPAPLVVASNVGSLTALLAYPLVIERVLPLDGQSRLFAALWGAWLVGTVGCAALASRRPAVAAELRAEATVPARQWLRYVALAAVPASMMLGVTTHLATDVGSFPLLWVVPLAIYLASFVVVFARTPEAPSPRVVAPYLGLVVMMFLFTAPQVPTRAPLVLGHLGLFAWSCLLFHGTLSRERPAPTAITSFQLALAVGGALGGAFNALIAPRVFVRVTEYPLALALGILLLPQPPPPVDPRARQESFVRAMGLDPTTVLGPAPPPRPVRRWSALDALVPLAVGALAAWLFLTPLATGSPALVRYGLPLLALVFASIGRRARLALGLVAILAASRLDRSVIESSRTFYGVMRVEQTRGVRRFLHGTTLHGLQYRSDKMRREPVAYYDRRAPLGQAMAALAPHLAGASVGVVGLGVGMLVAHAAPGQRWTFYELDPAVERIARTHFTWLRDAVVPVRVVTGDARATLARDVGARHRLLVLDAFSSDAIPVHLLTREAMAVYRTRVETGGVIAFHITNRHVALDEVLATLARDAGLVALRGRGAGYGPDGPVRTTWVLMAERAEDLGALVGDARWVRLRAGEGARAWTDDFSDLLGALKLR
jgi:hypothetical protein